MGVFRGMFPCPHNEMINLNNDSDAADGCFFIDITACSGYYLAVASIILSYVVRLALSACSTTLPHFNPASPFLAGARPLPRCHSPT